MKPPRILIIAGSDSGGGAGIQADIKTVTMLGGYAMTAITAITAQNTLGVRQVTVVPPEMVLDQVDAVVGDIGVDAVKIGMIGSPETAVLVAERLEVLDQVPIVFDPVMVASSGATLASPATIEAFERLMAIADLVTPNAPELTALTGIRIENFEQLVAAARLLAERSRAPILAKGGHLSGPLLNDLLIDRDGSATRWEDARIDSGNTHGTGCTLASAIATALGKGQDLKHAVTVARDYVRAAIEAAPGFGAGQGPMGHWAVPSPTAMNLNQVTVAADDYATSVAFYVRLGLTQIVDAPPHYARFECPGGATFSVHAAEPPSGTIIYFEAPDLESWVQRLQATGVEFTSVPTDQPWLWREARLRDPAGNEICLYRAGANRRFPPWRVE